MTSKIPVGATVARAYRFAFGNLINNLGAIWLPVAIMWIVTYFFYRPYAASLLAAQDDPQMLVRAMPAFTALFLFGFVLVAAQIAALTREALGLRTGNAFLQFPFGSPMWRLLANYVLFMLAMLAISIAVLVAIFIGGLLIALIGSLASGIAGKVVAGFAGVVGVIALLCGTSYAWMRLSFLLAPVAVAEGRVTLIRGWHLTAGNFWRIFIIALSILIPLLIVEVVYIWAVYGSDFFPPLGAEPDVLAQWQAHQRQIALGATERMQQYWYLAYPIALLFGLILYGLIAGASVFAYRALVPAANSAEPA